MLSVTQQNSHITQYLLQRGICSKTLLNRNQQPIDKCLPFLSTFFYNYRGFPGGTSGKEPACQCTQTLKTSHIQSLHKEYSCLAKRLVELRETRSHAMQGHSSQTGHSEEFCQTVVHWRRKCQPTSVFLPREPNEQYEQAKRYDTRR